MSQTIERRFATRAEAENAIELLVQQHGLERSDIFVAADGPDNSAGEAISSGDASAPLEEERDDAALYSPVLVSIDVNDDAKVAFVERALAEARAE